MHRSDAVHGSPYRYDRHVPLFFLGHGISAGTSDAAVRTVDLAPTLASVLGLEVPEDVAGEVLHLQPD